MVTVHGAVCDEDRDLTNLIMNTHLVLDKGEGVKLVRDKVDKKKGVKGPKIKGRKHGVGEKSIGIIDDVD